MKNPLLVPELREMLATHNIDELQDFCDNTPPAIAAEFLGSLTSDEEWEILENLTPEMRALIFANFDDDVKLKLIAKISPAEIRDLVSRMDSENREEFFRGLNQDKQRELRDIFKQTGEDEESALPEAFAQILLEFDTIIAELQTGEEELTDEEIASEISDEIEIYKTENNRFERVSRTEKGCLINIVNPSKENLPLIAQHFNIPIDFLTASLDIDETARIEIEDNCTLIIAKVPYYDEKNTDVLYFTLPIGIILVNGYIITVCEKSDTVIRDFIENRVRHVSTANIDRIVLQIILRATMQYLTHLKQLNNAANIIQKKLEQESRNKQLIKLFNIEKSLVYFTTSLKTNALMMERMLRLHVLSMDDENENLYEDIVTESRQAIEMANIYSDILSGMMDAFASIISNNLNIVMKVLTSITIIMTIPISVTSYFSMNVILPIQDNPYAFLMIISFSLLLSLFAIVFFVKKKWLVP
ncbi:MAG: hypothetical protein JW832_13705 [Deltaproteobacteria bacterium]|nr:hypothetical protein [Deltaproteobacteria bacterium]